VHPFSPGPQLARRLRSAEQQHAEQRHIAAVKGVVIQQIVLVLLHTRSGAEDHRRELLLAQCIHAILHRLLVVADHRLAVRRLIAGKGEAVQRQRIVLGVVRSFSSRQPSTRVSTGFSR
jgi:hypothetical protein